MALSEIMRRSGVLNPKTARSQIVGSIVGGIGMALQEESALDHAVGRFMTHNLADYHFPVHADVHDIDVLRRRA